MNKKYDVKIGERYNKFIVTGVEIEHRTIAKKKVRLIPCQCDCGKKSNVEIWKLVTGKIKFCNSCGKLGQIAWNKGIKTNQIPWNKGIKWDEMSGENHPRWIKDRNHLVKNEKKHLDSRYKEWMVGVKKRDNWECQINNEECEGCLEAHHILPWRDFPKERFNINNGITLCHAHHPRKESEEKRLVPIFQELVSVSKY